MVPISTEENPVWMLGIKTPTSELQKETLNWYFDWYWFNKSATSLKTGIWQDKEKSVWNDFWYGFINNWNRKLISEPRSNRSVLVVDSRPSYTLEPKGDDAGSPERYWLRSVLQFQKENPIDWSKQDSDARIHWWWSFSLSEVFAFVFFSVFFFLFDDGDLHLVAHALEEELSLEGDHFSFLGRLERPH